MAEDFKKLEKKFKEEIPKEANDISLHALFAYSDFMKSDAVPKDNYGNVKDFRLNTNQAKTLAQKVYDSHTKFVMKKLTNGKYAGNKGDYDQDMVDSIVKMHTEQSVEDLIEDLDNQEVNVDYFTKNIAGKAGNRLAQVRTSHHVSKLDNLVKAEDPDLAKHLKDRFKEYKIDINTGRLKSGQDVYGHLINLSHGIGDPDKYIKENKKHLSKYVEPKK